MNKIILRIILGIILLASTFIFPWWVFASLAIIFIFYFDFYIEAIFAGFILDVLYGAPSDSFLNFIFIFSTFSSIVFLLSFYIKSRLRFY